MRVAPRSLMSVPSVSMTTSAALAARLATGQVQVTSPTVRKRTSRSSTVSPSRAGVSGVTGTVEEPHDQFDLFASAFPAGTVSGAPKTRAMELIAELEPEPRGLYAGTVGYFGRGGDGAPRMDQAIAIRTLEFEPGAYRYRAGAGVVADSVPEKEHDEVLAKAGALERALEIAAHDL